jgi:hypothetical protein
VSPQILWNLGIGVPDSNRVLIKSRLLFMLSRS